MKKTTVKPLGLLLALSLLPMLAEAHPSTCKITDPSTTPLNVRASPNGQKIGTIKNGVVVQVLDHDSDERGHPWALISRKGRTLGWVYREYISCLNF